jgi:hypothetical protein
MFKAVILLIVTFLAQFLILSSIALHIEAFIVSGYQISADQISFPAIVLPVSAAFRGHNISLMLVIAGGLATGTHQMFFRRFVVERWHWVSEEQYHRLFGKT